MVFQVDERLRNTTAETSQRSTKSGGLTTSRDDSGTGKAVVSPTFHTSARKVTKIENVARQESRDSIEVDFPRIHIHTGWYVKRAWQEAQVA